MKSPQAIGLLWLSHRQGKPNERDGRYFDGSFPQERGSWLISACFVTALVAIPFVMPGLFSLSYPGMYGADPSAADLPYQSWVYDNVMAGRIPFWNPFIFAGYPLLSLPLIAPMYPPHFFFLTVFGPLLMLKLKYLAHLSLAGLGSWWFFRQCGVARSLSFIGALTVEWSGFHITRVGFPTIADVSAWVPLMLAFGLWLRSFQTLQKVLYLSLAGGIMLMYFMPQIQAPLIAIAVLLGLSGSAKMLCPVGGNPALARWLDRIVLPVLEIGLLGLALRYPNEGTKAASTGLGKEGVICFFVILFCWIIWFFTQPGRLKINWSGAGSCLRAFMPAWGLAGLLAAPQIFIVVELVRNSNLAGMALERSDFFTGAQAYGCAQNFIIMSACCANKEMVNNLALGPAIWLLVFVGIGLGLHRRQLVFFLFVLCVVLFFAVYFALPGIFSLYTRLPFFDRFPGIAYFMVFPNFFLIALAVMTAHHSLGRLPRSLRRLATFLVCALLTVNLGLLLSHHVSFWKRLNAHPPQSIPDSVEDLVYRTMDKESRFLIDVREVENFVPYYMFSQKVRRPGAFGNDTLRLAGYDRWLEAHNESLGLTRSGYHGMFFEPAPTPWTRALRVRAFLLPPGNSPPAAFAEQGGLQTALAETLGWRLLPDSLCWPTTWLETEPDALEPTPEIPRGWHSEIVQYDIHQVEVKVNNPGPSGRMVISEPFYPGWQAWVNGRRARIEESNGFLRSVSVPQGESIVRMEYRPWSFRIGWICFLLCVWVWILLWLCSTRRAAEASKGWRFWRRHVRALAAGVPLVVLAAQQGLRNVPDSLVWRIGEFSFVALAGLVTGFILSSPRLNRPHG